MQIAFVEEALHGHAGARTRLAHDEAMFEQCRNTRRPLLLEQRMIRRGHHHQRVLHEGHGLDGQVVRRLTHQHDVRLVVLDLLQQSGAVGDLEMDLHRREIVPESGQQLGGNGRNRGSYHQLEAAQLAVGDHLQAFRSGFDLLQQVAAEGQHLLAGVGEHQAAPLLPQQSLPYGLFELLDLHRYRGLGQVELARGAGEAAGFGDFEEDAQLSQGNVHGA